VWAPFHSVPRARMDIDRVGIAALPSGRQGTWPGCDDRLSDEAFDRLARLAARLLQAPIAFVTLIDDHTETFRSYVGLPEPWLSRWDAPNTRVFCRYVHRTGQPLLIRDTGMGGTVGSTDGGAVRGVVAYAGVPLRRPDGSGIGALCVVDHRPREWTDDDLSSLVDLADAVVAEVAVRAEVAERRRVEAALRESELRYRTLLETANEGICTVDADARMTFVNPRMAAMLGYTVVEMLGRSILDFIDELARPAALGRIEPRGGGAREAQELPFRHRDGSTVWTLVSAAPILDGQGRQAGALAMVTDITERKRVEEEQARLIATIEASTDLVAITDTSGTLLYLNNAGRVLLGIPEDEDLAASRLPGFHPAWAHDLIVKEWIPAAIRDGAWSGETVLRTRDGREVPVSQVIVAHKSPSGEVRFLSTVARDLSSHKRLEQQLRQSQRLEAVGRLAGGVAHDFNNLLTAIKGNTALILEDLPPAAPIRRDLEEILHAAERASVLTRQLLAFSRRQVLRPKVLDVASVVLGAVATLRRRLGEGIEIVTDLDPLAGAVHADPGQLEQVLTNLVMNARDAMPQGGTITIETRNAELGEEHMRRYPYRVQPGAYVRLVVRDTGHGMDEATLARIFEPFFTTKEPGKGTGLGLSTVYGIVKQSGGYIWAESEVGKGTRFEIYLPRVEAPADTGRPTVAPSAARGGRGEIVLLVEDEDAVRALARRILERGGYTVLEASHGEEAIRIADGFDRPIHLLLTDLTMPEMSGRELAERLVVRRPEMRVLYMSGYTEDDVVRRGILGHGAVFLEKPFTPETLGRKVRETLDA